MRYRLIQQKFTVFTYLKVFDIHVTTGFTLAGEAVLQLEGFDPVGSPHPSIMRTVAVVHLLTFADISYATHNQPAALKTIKGVNV